MTTTPLNFGTVSATDTIRTLATEYPHHALVHTLIITSLFLLAVFCLWVLLKKTDDSQELSQKFKLGQLPVSAKAAATLVMLGYGLVHVFSILTVVLKTKYLYTSSEDYFHDMPLHKLAALSHTHFFGHATLYGLMAMLFLFTTVSERKKRVIVLLAPVGAILDNASWWGVKMVSSQYELLSYAGGLFMLLGFALMGGITLWQLWRTK